jgi:hypothetical protein
MRGTNASPDCLFSAGSVVWRAGHDGGNRDFEDELLEGAAAYEDGVRIETEHPPSEFDAIDQEDRRVRLAQDE